MELEFQEVKFHANFFFVCDRPIPGSGSPIVVFSCNFLFFLFFIFYKCDRPILGSESLIVTFLSPIVAFSSNFFISVTTPYQV